MATALLAVGFSISPSHPQKAARSGNLPLPDKPNLGSLGERINSNTIAIVAGNPNATYLSIAYDLSSVLDDGDNLRILPVVGRGGGQNIRDVRYLRGVDLGITQSNLLNMFKRTNEIGNLDAITYIAKLFNEEMHIVVRSDSGIDSIAQLAGKKVNFSDSGTQMTARDVFQRLKVKAEEVNLPQADAFEKLKSGEIAATVLIAGKPVGAMARLRAADGFRFVRVPFAKQLQDEYLPAALTRDDYPGMIAEGQSYDTVAVGAVLIAYNWPKGSEPYRRIATFIDHFFPNLAEFQQPPRHPKWREANLAATLPGWTRFPAAEEWLKRHQPKQRPVAEARARFEQFIAARKAPDTSITAAQREQLFQEYLKWERASDR